MDPTIILLIIALVLGAVVTTVKAYHNGRGDIFDRENLNLLLAYADTVVVAVAQEYKDSDLPEEERDYRRKERAEQLMLAYAQELGLEVTPSLVTLISGAIEAAVLRYKPFIRESIQ